MEELITTFKRKWDAESNETWAADSIRWAVFHFFAGNSKKQRRQDFLQYLTAKKYPKNKCGCHRITEELIKRFREEQI